APCRFEHSPAPGSVDVYHPYAEIDRCPYGARHGIRDIVELQIQEYLIPFPMDAAHQTRSATGKQFLADLDPTESGIETLKHGERLALAGKVECDDDTAPGILMKLRHHFSLCRSILGIRSSMGRTMPQQLQPGQHQCRLRSSKPQFSQR